MTHRLTELHTKKPHLKSWLLSHVGVLARRAESFRPLPIQRGADHPWRRYSGRRVAIAGLFSTSSGVGRGAHLLALDLARRGADVTRIDLSTALRQTIAIARGDTIEPGAAAQRDIDDLIVAANPPLFRKALAAFDPAWLNRRCLIAHWVWELNVAPRFWRRSAALCDEIWTSSDFVTQAMRATLPNFTRPIITCPYPVHCDPFRRPTAAERAAARAALALSPETFCVGYSFAADSSYYRKNPEAAVDAFQQAFPADQNAVLLLRSNDLHHHPREQFRLLSRTAQDPRVRLLDHSRPISIAAFYAAIDVYLSPSRSEGYGLNLIEAAQAGAPVIAVGYGLSKDISSAPGVTAVTYDLIRVDDPQGFYERDPELVWAEPHLVEMASALRQIRDKPVRRDAL